MTGTNEGGPNPKSNDDDDEKRDAMKEKKRDNAVAEVTKNGKKTGSSKKGGSKNASAASNTSKVSAQLLKMKDANTKYKNLLKMAKERIEQQEIELVEMKEINRKLADEEQASRDSGDTNNHYLDDANEDLNTNVWNLVRVSQRIRIDLDTNESNARGLKEEIWALCDWEREVSDEQHFLMNNNSNPGSPGGPVINSNNTKRQWKRFDSELDLSDFIRRDTGEPLTLPPCSLTQKQSFRTTSEAEKKISAITEEYRRFRVKSEMTRKRMDSQIRDLQNSKVESTTRLIEGQNHVQKEFDASRRTESAELKRMRNEAARQEDQWKEAYDILLKENEALKSPGSDALLASQWRQRYEACIKERDEAVQKLQSSYHRHEQHKQQQHSASFSSPPGLRFGKNPKSSNSEGKYEMKYRDLKESFRLYRKKAKEIFESQAATAVNSEMMVKQGSQPYSNPEEDSKLSYLKNLMVNYLTSDPTVRDHMEAAIGTVLKFTPDDTAAIEKKKMDDESWGAYMGYT